MLWGVWPPEGWPRVELFRTKFNDRLSYPTAVLVFSIGGSFMIVGVPRESFPGERRVALVPAAVPNLTKAGLEGAIEAGARAAGRLSHADTTPSGSQTLSSPAALVSPSRTVL